MQKSGSSIDTKWHLDTLCYTDRQGTYSLTTRTFNKSLRNIKETSGISKELSVGIRGSLFIMASVPCTMLDFYNFNLFGWNIWKWGKWESSFELNLSCPELEHADNDFPSQGRTSILQFQMLKGWQKLSYNDGEPHNQKHAHGRPISQPVHLPPLGLDICHLLLGTFVTLNVG